MKVNAKPLLVSLLSLLSICQLNAQNYPDCKTMYVQDIRMDEDPAFVLVEIFNNCTDCLTGIQSCVYMEMVLRHNEAPYDTLAASQCYCFMTPENQTSFVYKINALTSELPDPNQIQVFFGCHGCQELPNHFVVNGIPSAGIGQLSFFPNPASDQVVIKSDIKPNLVQAIGVDGARHGLPYSEADGRAELVSLTPGIYLLQLIDPGGRVLAQGKLLKK